MCTITLAWQVFEDSPVVLAANRDELVDRPSEPPARRDWETAVVAPKDSEAAGTWIGYNEHGVLVAITNRWTDRSIDGDRSRGLLVRDALAYGSAREAVQYVERDLDGRTYQGFNLLVADANSALLVEWDGNPRVRTLDPGVHVVVNVGADGQYVIPGELEKRGREQAENANRLAEVLRPEPGEEAAAWLDRAAETISDHEYGVCIHRDSFGTRSSSLVHMRSDGVSYRYADGPPCETAFESVEATIPVSVE